jgi:hypothetical protein
VGSFDGNLRRLSLAVDKQEPGHLTSRPGNDSETGESPTRDRHGRPDRLEDAPGATIANYFPLKNSRSK